MYLMDANWVGLFVKTNVIKLSLKRKGTNAHGTSKHGRAQRATLLSST
jgi:hypothetical protein